MEGLYAGKKAGGTDGVFAPLMKHLLESMLAGELAGHLEEEKASGGSNLRNGKSKKTVRSMSGGSFELETGRDRQGTFEPKIVPKRQLIITEELEGNVLSMYARGMGTRAISDYIREMYAMEISRITDSVLPAITEWRNWMLCIRLFSWTACIIKSGTTARSRPARYIISSGLALTAARTSSAFTCRKPMVPSSGFRC